MALQKNTEDEQSSMTTGERELRRRGLQTTKNFHTLLNRINVLTQERDSRLRGIECKLNQHQQYLAKKVERHNYREELRELSQNRTKSTDMTLSKMVREERDTKRSRMRQTVRTMRTMEAKQFKDEQEEQERAYIQLRKRQHEENTKKRNMVRLQQLESRLKVQRFWENKLEHLRQAREQSRKRTLDTLNESLGKISVMEADEARLLRELERTDTIRDQLELIVKEDRKLDPKKLPSWYPRTEVSVTESTHRLHVPIGKFTRLHNDVA